MSKHTPGPWHVGGKLDAIVYAPDGYAVAGCQTYHGLRDEQSTTANARLIAAAPCLIEALRECITEDNAARLQTGSAAALFRRLQAINDTARAAIAKATGGGMMETENTKIPAFDAVIANFHKVKSLVSGPFDVIRIYWEVDGASGSTDCEAWRGLSELSGFARAGYTIKQITRGE